MYTHQLFYSVVNLSIPNSHKIKNPGYKSNRDKKLVKPIKTWLYLYFKVSKCFVSFCHTVCIFLLFKCTTFAFCSSNNFIG